MASSSQHQRWSLTDLHGSPMGPDPLDLSHPQPRLSLFQQTLLEDDELFYKTFPAARWALQQNQSGHIWVPQYSVADFAGYGFELGHLPSSDHQPPANAPSTHRVDGVPPASHFYTLHNQLTPHMPPSEMNHHESSSNPPPPPLHIATSQPFDTQYPPQYQRAHQHSPVSDSLASPGSFSDPAHALHHIPPHFGASPSLSSPSAGNFPAPVTPTTLIPSTFSPGQAEPEQRFFTDQQYSPSSVPPTRRGSQHQTASYRSQRRYSPQYNRTPHPAHNLSGSGGAHSNNMPVMEWTVTPSPTTAVNANVESSPARDTASPPAQAAATVTSPSVPSPSGSPEARPLLSEALPGSSNTNVGGNSKRNPDKKPALACVFCRGRKIACGPPLKDGDGKTCNQCQRRSLRCEYPTESRRGMRKKPAISLTTSSTSNSTKVKRNANTSRGPKADPDFDSPKLTVKNKRR